MSNPTLVELEKRLLLSLKSILTTLYPAGKIEGSEFCIADIEGNAGKSLKVNLKTGLWSDFSVGASGRILGLFSYRANGVFSNGLKEVYQLLKIPKPPQENFKKPKITWEKVLNEESDAISYLINERKIPKYVLKECKVRSNDDSYIFTGTDEECKLCYAQFTKVERNEEGKKIIFFEPKKYKSVLWGMNTMTHLCNYDTLVITEGVIDAMTFRSCDIFAVSIPSGVSDTKWIEYSWNWLSQFNTIYLCIDYDAAGQQHVNEIAGRLGTHRCKKVILPCKDANEVLLKHEEETSQLLKTALSEAQDIRPSKHLDLVSVQEQVFEYIDRGPIQNHGDLLLGWSDSRQETDVVKKVEFRIRPREWSIWSGYPGSGKTTLLFQHCAYSMFMLEQSVAIAALEEDYEQTIATLINQAIGLWPGEKEKEIRDYAYHILKQRLNIFSLVGRAELKEVTDFFSYCVKRHGASHCVLDSIMRTDIDVDGDKERVNKMIQGLAEESSKTDAHFHIVAHAAKGDDEKWEEMPSMSKVKGIQEITANAFNVLFAWRNKPTENQIAGLVAKGQFEEASRIRRDKPETIIKIVKNRRGKMLGQIPMWFDPVSNRFRNHYEKEKHPSYIYTNE